MSAADALIELTAVVKSLNVWFSVSVWLDIAK
jgi:hypothetical protein